MGICHKAKVSLSCPLHGGNIDHQGKEAPTELKQYRRFSPAEVYLGPCQTCVIELFVKTVSSYQGLTIFRKKAPP